MAAATGYGPPESMSSSVEEPVPGLLAWDAAAVGVFGSDYPGYDANIVRPWSLAAAVA
ncbi:hypothetical protein ACQEVB_23355 [Pseudonocardia sp. CA-107938]|uniref:hypothetical protein n=1 Tax=Pseudonocardia sp. CA-107938 TaxID=3240021 RepID=UPI003D913377